MANRNIINDKDLAIGDTTENFSPNLIAVGNTPSNRVGIVN